MKARTKKVFSVLLALGLAAACFLMLQQFKKTANAETVKVLSYEDNFDSAALDDTVWHMTGGVKHNAGYSALRLSGINVWGQYVVLQGTQLKNEWNNFTVEFDADWLNTASGWTGIFFGNPSPTGLFNNSRNFLHISTGADRQTAGSDEEGTGIRLCPKAAGSGFESTYGKTKFFTSDVWKKGDLSSGGEVVRIRLQFDKAEGSDEHILTFGWKFASDENGAYTEYSFGSLPMSVNGYMGFTTYGTTVFEMRNFSIVADGEKVFSDDFTESDVSYPSLPSGMAKWRCVGVTEAKVYCGNICTVDFADVMNGNLVYLNELSENPYCTGSFEMSYTVGQDEITSETYIGSGFGLPSITDPADKTGYVGFRKDGDVYKMTLIKEGVITGNEIEFSVPSGLTLDLKFKGEYGKNISVYVNDNFIAKFHGVDFNGYMAIGALSLVETATGNKTSIDNFVLYEYETLFADNGDYRIDFKGRKTSEASGGGERKDFWYNTRKWVRYGDVKEPNLTINQNRNYIMFQDTRMEAGFSPKAQFGDFIARFDFKVSSLDDTSIMLAPFGLSFGRENLASTSGSAPGVYFQPITSAATVDGKTVYTITGTRVVGLNMTTAGGGTGEVIDLNVFDNTDDWYTCMVVMSNRTVKVYLKKTSDGSSDFGKPLITFTNVDAHGYVAVTYNPSGSNYAYYWATNISVIGTDLLQKEAA